MFWFFLALFGNILLLISPIGCMLSNDVYRFDRYVFRKDKFSNYGYTSQSVLLEQDVHACFEIKPPIYIKSFLPSLFFFLISLIQTINRVGALVWVVLLRYGKAFYSHHHMQEWVPANCQGNLSKCSRGGNLRWTNTSIPSRGVAILLVIESSQKCSSLQAIENIQNIMSSSCDVCL